MRHFLWSLLFVAVFVGVIWTAMGVHLALRDDWFPAVPLIFAAVVLIGALKLTIRL